MYFNTYAPGKASKRQHAKEQWLSHLRAHQHHLEGLLGPPQSFSFRRAGQGLQICIPNKFPGNAPAAGPRTALCESLPSGKSSDFEVGIPLFSISGFTGGQEWGQVFNPGRPTFP